MNPVADFFVHPSSVVDDGAQIGAGTKIWHFCHVFGGARIGRSVVVGQGCSIASTVVIGDRCKIQNGVSIYDGVVLEEGVFCGPHMIFTNVVNPRALIERKSEFRPTLVKIGATIGAGAVIVCGMTLGEYSFVGAGAVVIRDVLPYALVVGNPARQIGWVGQDGVRLDFGDDDRVTHADGQTYRLVGGHVELEC